MTTTMTTNNISTSAIYLSEKWRIKADDDILFFEYNIKSKSNRYDLWVKATPYAISTFNLDENQKLLQGRNNNRITKTTSQQTFNLIVSNLTLYSYDKELYSQEPTIENNILSFKLKKIQSTLITLKDNKNLYVIEII